MPLQWFGDVPMLARPEARASDAALARGDGALLIHAGWKGNIVEQDLGKPSARHQPVVEGGRAQELCGDFSEGRIARREKPERVHRRGKPESSRSKKCGHARLEKQLQQILRGIRFVAQVLDLSEPMQALGFQSDAFVNRGRRRTLPKTLRRFGDQLRRNVFMVVQHPSLAKQRGEAGRERQIFGDGGRVAANTGGTRRTQRRVRGIRLLHGRTKQAGELGQFARDQLFTKFEIRQHAITRGELAMPSAE